MTVVWNLIIISHTIVLLFLTCTVKLKHNLSAAGYKELSMVLKAWVAMSKAIFAASF